MEALADQLTHETRKSFDILANVDDMRFDIENYGQVLPETREQVSNEQLSYLAEGIDRAARPTFVLRHQDGELVYFARGQWQPYRAMLETGVEVADREAAVDPRRRFLAEWAQNDYYHYGQMRRLQPGEQYVWSSAYPHEQEEKYGAQFLDSCGLRPDRKMGFLYRASRQSDGSVVLESQTIDRSDDQAIATALQIARQNPSANLDDMVQAYDDVLSQKQGGHFYAGRRNAEMNEDAWQKILTHGDLVNYLLSGLESIAHKAAPRESLEIDTKRHIYGVWALFKKRLDGTAQSIKAVPTDSTGYMAAQAWLTNQVNDAFREFASEGQVLIGCGGAISVLAGEQSTLEASSSDVFASIFGGNDEDKYGSLSFSCPKGHMNRRPRGRLISHCKSCGISVKC